MKSNQSRPRFELVSLFPFPATITIIPRASPDNRCISIVLSTVSLVIHSVVKVCISSFFVYSTLKKEFLRDFFQA